MSKTTLLIVAAAAGLALAGCDNNNSGSSQANNPQAPSNFVSFVGQQVQTQPAFGDAQPASTASLGNLGLDDATAFANVNFGTGDAVPAGTYQASVACTQAGKTGCDPTVSSDPNSTLN